MPDDEIVQKKNEMYGEAKESPFVNLGRKVLIGVLAVALTVLLLLFVLIRPQTNEISLLQAQLAAAGDQIATLEGQIADLEGVKPQREILSLLTDANTARYELANEPADEASASASLLNTGRTLTLLGAELGSEYADTITALQARLALVKKDIADNRNIAAISDLGVFINILQELQRSIFSP